MIGIGATGAGQDVSRCREIIRSWCCSHCCCCCVGNVVDKNRKKLSQNKEWARAENPAQHKSLETGKRSQRTAVGKRKEKDVALIVTVD